MCACQVAALLGPKTDADERPAAKKKSKEPAVKQGVKTGGAVAAAAAVSAASATHSDATGGGAAQEVSGQARAHTHSH
jgi:hypothetical protein